MLEQEEIDDHLLDVHDIEGGASSLKPLQEIDMDTKITFSLPSLLDIELVVQSNVFCPSSVASSTLWTPSSTIPQANYGEYA